MSDGNQATAYLSDEADAEYELESEEGAIWTGTRLLIGLVSMAWAAVVFAFFYLRAIDVGPAWRPAHVGPSQLLGTLVGGCVLGGAVLMTYAYWKFRQGLGLEWTILAFLSAAFGLVGTALQVWLMARLHFFPGESGFTSLFVGFGPLNALFILGGVYWAETQAARTLRVAKEIGPESYLGLSTVPEVRVLRSSIDGCVLFWWYMVAIEVLFYILFYIIR